MISKINYIKNLGLLFKNYSPNPGLVPFKRYNLIYGWNGSGKTTFSNLFDALETGKLDSMPDLEYEIQDGSGAKFKENEPYNKKIRVFNTNYIENNLKIKEGKANSITLILGDVDRSIIDQLEQDNLVLGQKTAELKLQKQLADTKANEKGKLFTEIAKTIYVAIVGGATRNYRKNDAEADFVSLDKKHLLSNEQLNKHISLVKQEAQPFITEIPEIKLHNEESDTWEDLETIIINLNTKSKALLSETVESEIITRLKDNIDISNWVETGLNIHGDHNSENCEFCGQLLPQLRVAELSKHFNQADKTLKLAIDKLLDKYNLLSKLISSISFPDSARLYSELRNEYSDNNKSFEEAKQNLLKQIIVAEELINQKKAKTTESIVFDKSISVDLFVEKHQAVKTGIIKHDKKTSDFESEKKQAIADLKNHYLSTIFDQIKLFEKEIETCLTNVKTLNSGDPTIPDDVGIGDLKVRIFENQKKISSTLKACDEINKGLSTFLGRDELIFEPHKITVIDEDGTTKEIEDGYILKRNGLPVNNLSEGEKTAIAFVYFTIHLTDQNFDITNGIVVIDDPISSLDSNSLFQAFAFLKSAVRDASQIFVLTHNFDFLKLLLNWVRNDNRGQNANYFMIKNKYLSTDRYAYLDKMDKELSDYESEYHYLYKVLKNFESDGTIAQSYPIPNIARKVLETFLMFRVPMGGSPFKKLEKIRETTSFDPVKLTAIYKFTNDESHMTGGGFDPALVPETQKNVKYILEMIAEIFPEHCQILEESLI